MQNRDDEYPLSLDEIDQAVGAEKKLAKAREFRIAKPVPPVGKVHQRVSSINRELRQAPGIPLRVPGNEFDSGFEVFDGGARPDYRTSHFAKRFLTCSWVWTRPAATASMLRWTF